VSTYSHISTVFGSCRLEKTEGLEDFFVTGKPLFFKRGPAARLHHPHRPEVTKVDSKGTAEIAKDGAARRLRELGFRIEEITDPSGKRVEAVQTELTLKKTVGV
jgi:hypothetical protein